MLRVARWRELRGGVDAGCESDRFVGAVRIEWWGEPLWSKEGVIWQASMMCWNAER